MNYNTPKVANFQSIANKDEASFGRSFPSKVIQRLTMVKHEESTHIPPLINTKVTPETSSLLAYSPLDNKHPLTSNTIEEHPTKHQSLPFWNAYLVQ